ncbi:hypothetical protein EC973_008784 [Apophysomyces ossiformis]|uniref:SAM domain-containing protein n=1 Tax=Apophysomyces ossiformis TaxID=679940 RepID=A0A8H7C0G4_9FUNG|nr:hypothetical protein EC973_008784 [Apophysomyces ossiformis]
MNILQQLVKRDPLHSILTPANPDQGDMASQLPKANDLAYKPGQPISRPPRSNINNNGQNNRAVDRHSFAMGDTEELTRMFGRTDFFSHTSNDLLDRNMQRSSAGSFSRPRSVIEGDAGLFFTPSSQPRSVGNIGERPKSADIAAWPSSMDAFQSPWGIPSINQLDPNIDLNHWQETNYRRRMRNIPGTVPEADERKSHLYDTPSPIPSTSSASRKHLAPPGMEKMFGQFLNPADAYEDHDYLSDHSEASNGRLRPRASTSTGTTPRANKDKKPLDVVDMELLKDIPAWFRSLRLHKYNNIFEPMRWQDIIRLTDEELEAKGVAALGARRKMLKVFENIRAHCQANVSEYTWPFL